MLLKNPDGFDHSSIDCFVLDGWKGLSIETITCAGFVQGSPGSISLTGDIGHLALGRIEPVSRVTRISTTIVKERVS